MSQYDDTLRIGIPVLNGGEFLVRLIESIDTDAEVLIVVNRIGPVVPSVVKDLEQIESTTHPQLRVTVKLIDGNLGVSGSWNTILDHFGGHCIISNNDIQFRAGVLREIWCKLGRQPSYVLQYIHAAACFYASDRFCSTLGWFDENFYPGYREDQEMSMRVRASGASVCNVVGVGNGDVQHAGSRTLHTAHEPIARFIRVAKRLTSDYLFNRWGTVKAAHSIAVGTNPFGDPVLKPSDWYLDCELRREIAKECKRITGYNCPFICCRFEGGLRM